MLPNSFYGISIRLPYAVFCMLQFRPVYLFSFKMLFHGSLLCDLNACIMVCLATDSARLTPCRLNVYNIFVLVFFSPNHMT